MIEEIIIQNFKSLKNIKLEIKPLSLLMGLNGMGKSSVIQSLLVLRQSRDLHRGNLTLNDHYVEIGKGKDAMYQYSDKEDIKISVCYSGRHPLSWNFKYNPDSNNLESEDKYEINSLEKFTLFNNNFQYLKAERLGPKTDYPTSYSEVISNKQIGIDGRFATHFLNVYGSEKIIPKALLHPKGKSATLMHQVDAWLGEITPGVKLNTTEIPGTDKVLLDFQFETGSLYTQRFRPQNVGFGLSYVLPVILSLLYFQKDKLIIIENPESHIHPRGQVELGKLIALAANSGAQVIIETHSDHIVNGTRVAVKDNLIDNQHVSYFYFDKVTNNEEQFSKCIPIKISETGELSQYPINFLDEWNNQLFNLM